jgi:hypothetical protein
MTASSVAYPDMGSGAYLTYGSGIRDDFFRILNHKEKKKWGCTRYPAFFLSSVQCCGSGMFHPGSKHFFIPDPTKKWNANLVFSCSSAFKSNVFVIVKKIRDPRSGKIHRWMLISGQIEEITIRMHKISKNVFLKSWLLWSRKNDIF